MEYKLFKNNLINTYYIEGKLVRGAKENKDHETVEIQLLINKFHLQTLMKTNSNSCSWVP